MTEVVTMVKFKVGDKVKIVKLYNPLEGQEQFLGKVATIVDIDEDWIRYPYELDIDSENLYNDYELEPVIEEVEEVTEESIVEAIKELSKRVKKFTETNVGTRETSMVLTKLDEARLWAKEFDVNYGNRYGELK